MFDRSRFFAIPSAQVDEQSWWVRPLLEEFDRRTDMAHPDDILDQARVAECQLWSYFDGGFRGVLVTQIRKSRKGSICLLWVCIGLDVVELVGGVMEQVEAWAKEQGCRKVQLVARKGWEKVLPGFKRKAVVLEKHLGELH